MSLLVQMKGHMYENIESLEITKFFDEDFEE